MLIKSYNDRELKRLSKTADKILNLNKTYRNLSDEALQGKTLEFKRRLQSGETLDDILVEAFAVCREAASRVLGMKQYKVQLIGGIVIHQGRIAEMKTGEGKTLTETCPAYLNALEGKGTHIVTVNDYLAERDMHQMKPLFEFLGLTVGVVKQDTPHNERQEAYRCDITYTTNNEIGFDFLRDHMAVEEEDKVQRDLHFVVLDEVDSILIDEARTPLIISGEGDKPTELYRIVDRFIKKLIPEDYEKDEKENAITLSEKGIKKAERVLGIENLASVEYGELNHYLSQSLRANYMMIRDKDYLVKDGEVIIIDEFTGRIADGRRFSEGLHQAIEAKENLEIKAESKTLATITYQNLFRSYKKLSGMTGTCKTEEAEFREIYNLDVIVIPTNKPIARIDNPDKVFLSHQGKVRAIINDIINTHRTGRPILVCTPSVEKSEELSLKLNQMGIPHQLLNAKYHEQEADIVSRAGERGKITIATNMAGRGTDIKLSKEVEAMGGLKVIGTERAYNRRIDNQLVGRAGRQGDKGESQFYVSLDDDLLRVFGLEKLKSMLEKQGFSEADVIQNPFIHKQIVKAQKRIEGVHFDERKQTIKYDDVINEQRKIIYSQRQAVLHGEELEQYIDEMIKETVESIVERTLEKEECEYDDFETNTELHNKVCLDIFNEISLGYLSTGKEVLSFERLKRKRDIEELEEYINSVMEKFLREKIALDRNFFEQAQRKTLLSVVDKLWMEHVDEMTELKKMVRNAGYKQQDPVQAYQLEGSKVFGSLVNNIRETYIRAIFNIQIFVNEQLG
ncbi:preprotein translocase subunit SecA [Clostridium massiliamazoniense]|uniref:preprotein translocase subunit SecA n=1 Tax=Clostridium massiliamazoniense TaxID=1347366 RepID=UPI0006D7A570|nr:preprotein translocase subunit SecA [Clostridium massiliamazoniense]